MKFLVCGGREYGDDVFLFTYLDEVRKRLETDKVKLTHVIHGDARGADRLAQAWAVTRAVQPVRVPALWEMLGPKAGAFRNANMLALLDQNDFVIAFPGGAGTAHMVSIAMRAKVTVIQVEGA
jgi:hypothetical protein